MMISTPAVSTNSVTLSETVLRHVVEDRVLRHQRRRGVLPVCRSGSTAANQSWPPMMTSMTPARSPNMNSGWPPATMPSSDAPCQPRRSRRHGDDLEGAVGDRQHIAVGPSRPAAGVLQQVLGGVRCMAFAVGGIALASSPPQAPASPWRRARHRRARSSATGTRSAAMTIRKMMMRAGIDGAAAVRRPAAAGRPARR